jgi:hypothetical protein
VPAVFWKPLAVMAYVAIDYHVYTQHRYNECTLKTYSSAFDAAT